MRKILCLLLALTLLAGCAAAEESWIPLQDCHRVKLTWKDTKQSNGSIVRLWHAETALPEVTQFVNSLAEDLAEELGPALPKGKGTGSGSSRADVEIRYSRTGLSWLSFLVQARVSKSRKLTDQRIASVTFDMATGAEIGLTDIFADDSPAWEQLAGPIREQITAYFPDKAPDEAALAAAVTAEGLSETDFTLHGMSLVLHYPAERFYPGVHTLLEVTLMYPDIREYMTPEAQAATDNTAYYRFAALTFDDGPSRTNTTLVLQSLMKAGVRGTFFVIGNRIANYQDLVQREHDEGHAIGGHNWHHGNVSKSAASALRQMPAKVNRALIAAIGIPTRYDRVPYGLYPKMEKAKAGWAYIQWSLDTYDWRGRSTANIMQKVRKQATDGDIVLMHDIKDKTPATTLEMAQWMQENGFMLLTVDELFAKDGITLEPNRTYWRNAGGETGIKH
ncbi:MAG: polysaccharide deacetylase family protein [Clostridia bacterium]|nr:polysaccharide deacetylase family protein [Clostridia bacterium]